MKNIFFALGIVAVVALVSGCTDNKAAEKSNKLQENEAIPVRTIGVSSQSVAEPVVASGLVASSTEARLSFKTGGIIQRILVNEGDYVKAGQLLASLNLTEINAQVAQASEALAKAERDYLRVKNLHADSVATLEQLQNATTAYNVAKQNTEIARFNQSHSEIRAVANGKIIRKLMNEGELAAPGTPVFYFNATGAADWLVRVGVADKDWVRLQANDRAEVRFDAFPEQVFEGYVHNLAQGADPMSGLYQVEIKLRNAAPSLAAGLFATVQLQPTQARALVAVPVDALVEGKGEQAFVFLPEGGKAKKRAVKVAYLKGEQAMIYAGLNGSEQIITSGSAYLTDQSLIVVLK